MRIPTFSRHADATEDERPTVVSTTGDTTAVRPRTDDTTAVRPRTDPPPPPPPRSTVARPSEETTREFPAQMVDDRTAANRDANVDLSRVKSTDQGRSAVPADVPAGPKPRASFLATLGLILGVAGALLVLSGPLLGWGIGVAGMALVLSLAGLRATRRRHVAGKTDALIGLLLSLGAIVVGVLALTGSLAWAGTDVPAVTNLREWLDTQFANRF